MNANFGFEVDFGAPSSSEPTSSEPTPAEQPPVKRRKTTARGDDDPVFTDANPTTHLRDEEAEQPTRNVKRATKSRRKLPVDEDDEAQRPCANHADDSFVAHTKSKKGGGNKKVGESLVIYEDGEQQPPAQRVAAKGRGRTAAPKEAKTAPSEDISIESKSQKSQNEPIQPVDEVNPIDDHPAKPTRGTKRKSAVAPRGSRRKVLAVDAEAGEESREARFRENSTAKQSNAGSENEMLPTKIPAGGKASPKPNGQRKRAGRSSRRQPLAETDTNASPQKQEQNWIGKDNAKEKPADTNSAPARPAKGRATTTRGQPKSSKKAQTKREDNCDRTAEDMSREEEAVSGRTSTANVPGDKPDADAQDHIQNLAPPDQTFENQPSSQGKVDSDDQQANIAGPGTPSPGRKTRTARAPRTRKPQQPSENNSSKPEDHVSTARSAASQPTSPISSTPNTSPQAIPEPSPSPQKKAAPPPPGTPPTKTARLVARPPKDSEHEEKKKPKMRIDPETGDPSRRETVRTRKVDEGAGGLKRQLFKKNAPVPPPPIAEEADSDEKQGNASVDDEMDWLFAPIEKQQRMPHQPARSAKAKPAGKKRESYGRLGDIDLDDLCTNIVSFAGVGANNSGSAQPAAARALKVGKGRGMR